MKISVVIPSKGRPDQLAAGVKRLFETTRGHDVEAVIVCDEDETRGLVEDTLAGTGQVIWVVESLKVIPAFNAGLAVSTGDAVVLGADDLWWGDGWLDAALAALGTLDDLGGLVGLNDGAPIARDYATHYLMTRRYIAWNNGGVLACPHYEHTYIDPEACARAMRAGRYVYAADAVVEHRHWLWGKAAKDPTYAEADGTFERDRATYERRFAAGFPDDYAPVIEVPHVWWAVLHERTLYEGAVRAIEDVTDYSARRGFHRIQAGYAATDAAREMITRAFLDASTHPDDVLILLDNDHLHPADVVDRLAGVKGVGVVGALCRRRGYPFDELIQQRPPDGGPLKRITGFEYGDVVPCSMAGGGAMAIRRWVFDRLRAVYGFQYWFWRYVYDDHAKDRPGEEVYFYRMCEEAGISIGCDTGTISPHLTIIPVEGLLELLGAAERGEDWRDLVKTP